MQPDTASPPPTSTPLFRPEALAAQSSQFLGGIRIATPPALWLVSSLAGLLVFALVAFATLGHATRRVQVAGVLMPPAGLLQVGSPAGGRVLAVKVREGERVEAGQLMAVLGLSTNTDRGDTGELAAQAMRARQEALQSERRSVEALPALREQALNEQLRSLQAEGEQINGELVATLERVRLAQASFDRDQGLARQGFLSAAQLQVRQEALLDLQVRERDARRNLETLRRQSQSLRADLDSLRLQTRAQLAQLDRSEAALAQEGSELAARNRIELRAPARGDVGAVVAQIGQMLQPGQTVLQLVPSEGSSGSPGALQAQLYAPSRTAGFVESGQEAWLRLEAFPYQKFGMLPGRVAAVSRTPVQPQDLTAGLAQSLLSAAQANEPLY